MPFDDWIIIQTSLLGNSLESVPFSLYLFTTIPLKLTTMLISSFVYKVAL